MKSMTGYGRAAFTSKQLELEISVKAVNGRFLEMRFHLPREYMPYESEFKKLMGKYFVRGTLDIYVNRHLGAQADTTNIQVNTVLAKKWLKAYRDLSKKLSLHGEPSVDMILRVPDVLTIEEHSKVTEAECQMAQKLLAKAAASADTERKREGAGLRIELARLLAELEKFVKAMETHRQDANRELEKKFRERLGRLGLDQTLDAGRLAQEVMIQVDRSDINEEIHRLREHIKAYQDLVRSSESHGKKLDFYAQELLREVNTVGSKSQLTGLTNAVVEAKAIVERIREQVQNVE